MTNSGAQIWKTEILCSTMLLAVNYSPIFHSPKSYMIEHLHIIITSLLAEFLDLMRRGGRISPLPPSLRLWTKP